MTFLTKNDAMGWLKGSGTVPTTRESNPGRTLIEGIRSPRLFCEGSMACQKHSSALVCLDSDPHTDHVLTELQAYGKYVPEHRDMPALDTILQIASSWKRSNPSNAVEKFSAVQKELFVHRVAARSIRILFPQVFSESELPSPHAFSGSRRLFIE